MNFIKRLAIINDLKDFPWLRHELDLNIKYLRKHKEADREMKINEASRVNKSTPTTLKQIIT